APSALWGDHIVGTAAKTRQLNAGFLGDVPQGLTLSAKPAAKSPETARLSMEALTDEPGPAPQTARIAQITDPSYAQLTPTEAVQRVDAALGDAATAARQAAVIAGFGITAPNLAPRAGTGGTFRTAPAVRTDTVGAA
ncbi:MAG: hypothetical protein AAF245_01510, partial [Pseudomonadota bacterium]